VKMEYLETLKLGENDINKVIEIESVCFQRICKSVEDASWDSPKLNRDEFALG